MHTCAETWLLTFCAWRLSSIILCSVETSFSTIPSAPSAGSLPHNIQWSFPPVVSALARSSCWQLDNPSLTHGVCSTVLIVHGARDYLVTHRSLGGYGQSPRAWLSIKLGFPGPSCYLLGWPDTELLADGSPPIQLPSGPSFGLRALDPASLFMLALEPHLEGPLCLSTRLHIADTD